MSNRFNTLGTTALTVATICVCPVSSFAQVNVLMGGYGAERTNSNPDEQVLNTSNVNTEQFGKIFELDVDGQVYAQPLYVYRLVIERQRRNVLYVATMHNTVYAFDADAAADPIWSVNLGPSVPATDFKSFDIAREIGILSTPVIDRSTNTLYVVANTKEDGRYFYRLHALDLKTGEEKNRGPVVIDAEVPGTGDGSDNGSVRFDAFQHLQRPALLLLRGVVYISFGSHGDLPPYHGWLFGYLASNVQVRTAVLNFSPHGNASSLWQGGRGPAADKDGFIYVSTANGSYDGVTEWGQSFLKIDTRNGLSVADWFTPEAWDDLNGDDTDVGSTGAVLLPGTDLVLGGDKGGYLYLLNRNGMGGMSHEDGGAYQQFQAMGHGAFNLAVWDGPHGPIVYTQPFGDVIRAHRFVEGRLESEPASVSPTATFSAHIGLTVSSNSIDSASAVLWATTTSARYPNPPFIGVLRAFDATDLSRELWNSEQLEEDAAGLFAKFANPTVADGRVYVPTFSGHIAVYGLRANPRGRTIPLPSAPLPTLPIAQTGR